MKMITEKQTLTQKNAYSLAMKAVEGYAETPDEEMDAIREILIERFIRIANENEKSDNEKNIEEGGCDLTWVVSDCNGMPYIHCNKHNSPWCFY